MDVEVHVSSRILVTGGAGFIGSHLVNKLTTLGYSLVVLDNFSSGKIENLGQGSFKLVKGDIRERKVVSRALSGIDVVVHLAALINVERSVKDPVEIFDVNVTGALNVLMEAVRAGVKGFIYASSAAVYGEGNPLPFREDSLPKPISPYAASKAAIEQYCQVFHRSYGLQTVILRYFNVYGPKQECNSYGGVAARFVGNALDRKPLVVFGDGEQTRDFVYIEDAVNATLLALENSNATGKILNVCSGKPTSVNKLAKMVKEVVGGNSQILHDKPRKGDVRNNYGDPTMTKEILGFTAGRSLREGLERYINSMNMHI